MMAESKDIYDYLEVEAPAKLPVDVVQLPAPVLTALLETMSDEDYEALSDQDKALLRSAKALHDAEQRAGEWEKSTSGAPVSFDWLADFRFCGTELTPREMAIVYHICSAPGLSFSAACRRAGVPESDIQKYRKRAALKAALAAAASHRLSRLRVNADMVIRELASLARSDITDVIDVKSGQLYVRDFSEIPREARAAIKSVTETVSGAGLRTLKVEFHDKKGALDTLARMMGLFRDKLEITENVGLVEAMERARVRVIDARKRADIDSAEYVEVTSADPDY